VIEGHVILCVCKVLPFEMLLLEGQNGHTWKDHMHNCALCHLPIVDDQIHPPLVIVLICLLCMLCKQFLKVSTMLIYNWCSIGWYMGYLTSPME
jgi:hypothetical protein